MHRLLALLCLTGCARAADDKTSALTQFNGALEKLAVAVAPAVVQIQVSAWCGGTGANHENAAVLTSCRVVGSGVIVDSGGYIITNEHVVRNARSIRVMLTPKSDHSADTGPPGRKREELDAVVMEANQEPLGKRQVLDAVVVGTSRETDVAVLKIEASGLPVISIHGTGPGPRQGQIVLAVGSPEGLDNTMTVGIVSAVGRQPEPDFPMLYIQTDAAINPGNSGGPLLDVRGELIGINTFVLSDTGRNQGLGFAVPAAVVRYVYEQLRAHGMLRQSLVGVLVQSVTPGLAQGLNLARGYGLMISDVLPGSPAETAGLRSRDIITAVDGASVSTLPYYTAMMYLHDPSRPRDVTVLRGSQTLQFQVPAVTIDDRVYRDLSIDPHESLIAELNVFGKTLTPAIALRSGWRSNSGVYVIARTAGNEDSGTELAPGDVIAALNETPVLDMEGLRKALHELKGVKTAVLQIERRGQFIYIERDL
ncbi:MAG: trypsin-like peptidase domain-containing protein [Candidatus Solibacter sp.]